MLRMDDSLTPQAHADATVVRGGGAKDGLEVHGRFLVVCVGQDGTREVARHDRQSRDHGREERLCSTST
jgi:hypothetical protein